MKNQNYIDKAMKKESFELKEMENFYTWEEAKPFLIEVGKKARKIANANAESIFAKKMMHEVEEAYFRAMKADCGFMVNAKAASAMGWLVKMVNTFN